MIYGEKERKIIMKDERKKKMLSLNLKPSQACALRENTKSKRLFGERAGRRTWSLYEQKRWRVFEAFLVSAKKVWAVLIFCQSWDSNKVLTKKTIMQVSKTIEDDYKTALIYVWWWRGDRNKLLRSKCDMRNCQVLSRTTFTTTLLPQWQRFYIGHALEFTLNSSYARRGRRMYL